MQVIHDGVVHEVPATPANLLELLRPILGDGAEARVVTALRLDGESVPEDALGDLSAIPSSGVTRVEVASESARSVALRTLSETTDYAHRVRDAIRSTADALRLETIEAASDRFGELLDGLSVLVGTSELLCSLLSEEKESLEAVAADLLPWLDGMGEAHAARDWVRLADLLEYELEPRVAAIDAWLQELSVRCDAPAFDPASQR